MGIFCSKSGHRWQGHRIPYVLARSDFRTHWAALSQHFHPVGHGAKHQFTYPIRYIVAPW